MALKKQYLVIMMKIKIQKIKKKKIANRFRTSLNRAIIEVIQ